MKPRLSDVELVAFAAISRFRSAIWDTIPIGSSLALRQTFSWCYMPSRVSTEVRSGHRRYPGTARQRRDKPCEYRHYARRWIFFLGLERGEVLQVQPLSDYFSRTYSSNRETLVMQNRYFFIT